MSACARATTLRGPPRGGRGRWLRHRDGADLDLAVRVGGEPRDLHGGRGGQVATEILCPHAIEIVLLAHVGEIARGGDQVLHSAARRLQGLPEILHGEDGLFAHGPREVELLLTVRMAVVHGRGRHAREEEQATPPHEKRRRVRHHHVGSAVGMVNGTDILGHDPRHHSLSAHSRQASDSRYRPRYAPCTYAPSKTSRAAPDGAVRPQSSTKPRCAGARAHPVFGSTGRPVTAAGTELPSHPRSVIVTRRKLTCLAVSFPTQAAEQPRGRRLRFDCHVVLRVMAMTGLVLALGLVPSTGAAQPATKMPRVGVLRLGSPPDPYVDAFRRGLRDLGYVEGQTIALEYRWAEGKATRLPAIAAEQVQLKVDVIVTQGEEATRAAKEATSTIPIVMASSGDPVVSGLVKSLARPGGNVTGLSTLAPEIIKKQLQLLKEAVPRVSRVAICPSRATWPSSRVSRKHRGRRRHWD